MKHLICMFMIAMTVTIFLKYDKNLGAKQSIQQVEKVKLNDSGILFCLDKSCGEDDDGWDGYVPYESIIMIQENSSRDKADKAEKFEKEESKY